MFRIVLSGVLLAGAAVSAAQSTPNVPATMPMQPGAPQPTTPPADPNAVPLAPPSFAPGTGGGNSAAGDSGPKVIRISGGVMAGRLITKVDPVIPAEARTAGVNGAVVMAVRIGLDGHVQDVSVVSGPPLLRQPYMDAVKQWRYQPYDLHGTPVAVDTVITLFVQANNSQ